MVFLCSFYLIVIDSFTMKEGLPCFEAVEGVLHTLLVVLDHVCMHLGVVAPDVPLCATVWDGPESEWGVLLLRLLELRAAKEKLDMTSFDFL